MEYHWNIVLTSSLILLIGAVYGSPTGESSGIDSIPMERNFKGTIQCQNHDDCPTDYCCMLGMQRYSIPSCFPYGITDDPCMPSNPSPRNFSLSYPNTRKAVEVKSAYVLLCPCANKFHCDRDTNSCQDLTTGKSSKVNLDEIPNSNDIS